MCGSHAIDTLVLWCYVFVWLEIIRSGGAIVHGWGHEEIPTVYSVERLSVHEHENTTSTMIEIRIVNYTPTGIYEYRAHCTVPYGTVHIQSLQNTVDYTCTRLPSNRQNTAFKVRYCNVHTN